MSVRTRWLLASAAVLALLVAWLVFRPNTKAAQVVTVQRADLAQSVVATGRVNAVDRVDVGSEVTATVVRVAVREGDRVAKGAVLVQLSDTEARATLAQAEAALAEAQARQTQLQTVGAPVANAALAQAQANHTAAQAEHRRATELVAQGFYSQQKADDTRRALDVAAGVLAAARLQAQAQQPQGAEVLLAATRTTQATAAVDAARARLTRLTLTSPIDAVVLTRQTEPGNLAQPGKVLLTLASTTGLRIDAGVDEKHLSLMRPGLAARAVADAYPAQTFDASLSWVSPAVDAARGTVDVRLAVAQPPAFLRPDMTVSVDMTVGKQAQALVVDAGAVRGIDTPNPWALRLVDGKAARTALTLGLRGTGAVEVKTGLAEGDLVIPSTEKVADGDRVKPTQAAPVPMSGMGMGR
ncbi:MAG: efflux RND transporter periplasmic adaptor subunit [Burkholderiales bacterium]|nr:efflux RND transporter periplasmic adaptor subunit [Burkholderiales bacterium]